MRALRSTACWLWMLVALVCALPSAGHADSIDLSNPYFYVYNYLTYHRPGDPFSTPVSVDDDANTTGNLSMSSSTAYANVDANSNSFSLRASSNADGTYLAPNGWDSISTEGLALFESDFVVNAPVPRTVYLSYVLYTNVVSTDPWVGPGFGPGTSAGLHGMDMAVYQGSERVISFDTYNAGTYVLSGTLNPGTLYHLRMVINAVSGMRESAGYASAISAVDATLSFQPAPEPSAGLLVLAGLIGFSGRHRRAP
jgi:hypothetical protein